MLARQRIACPQPDPEDADLRRDVLQRRLAEVVRLQRHLAGGVLAHAGGNADAARLGQRLQSGRDDDTVAQQVFALGHHLALVDADAQAQAVGLGAQCVLNGDGAAQCLHRAGELHEEAIASSLEQPAAMRGGEWLDDFGAQPAHARQCARLIGADHGGIANHVGCQDASQTAARLAHSQNSVATTLRRRCPPDKRGWAGRCGDNCSA